MPYAMSMSRTIVGFDPVSRVRGLLVEVHPSLHHEPPEQQLRVMSRRLYDRNLRVGLLVTPGSTYVLRDLLTAVDFRQNRYRWESVPTRLLLATVGVAEPSTDEQALAAQVRLWLESAAASWHSFVPPEATGLLVPEVVGELAQSDFEEWDGVLGPEDAVA